MSGSKINRDLDRVIELLTASFYKDFARQCAAIIIEQNAVELIYTLATEQIELAHPKPQRDMIAFRAAYVLETIYFVDRNHFEPYRVRFMDDFAQTKSESAKRHFTKMMDDILKLYEPTDEQSEAIAQACIFWITEPKTRVAVQIWAVEILLKLCTTTDWLKVIMPEIVHSLTINPSPAIISRHRKWQKQIR